MRISGKNGVGSTVATWPAICTGKSDVSMRLIFEMQEHPVSNAFQKTSMPVPKGVTIPIPVTATRRRRCCLCGEGTISTRLEEGARLIAVLPMAAEY
jgi:hypothetical protein